MLGNKTILVISPQSWGSMFLSKHHYALELASAGNKVYFLNPPDIRRRDGEKIIIEPSSRENLFLIHHRITFPYNLKFRLISVFHALMKQHVAQILRAIAEPVDIVWSFDLGWLYPFSFFSRRSVKIFHPVDEPLTRAAINSATGADVIFSVTREILEKYRSFPSKGHLINHGLSAAFSEAVSAAPVERNPCLTVGFSGNLLRPDIDRSVFLQIASEHPQIKFECFGPYKPVHSNIGGEDDASTQRFIEMLQQLPNVVMNGIMSQTDLARHYQRMDAWLICYDIKKDQSGGTNYHKIMEYLSTGKVIVSNNVSAYASMPELVTMPERRTDNDELPGLFRQVVESLNQFNSEQLQHRRREYALANTYGRQINRISECLEKVVIDKR